MSKQMGTAWCPLCGPLKTVGSRGECLECDENAMGPGADDASAALALVKQIKEYIKQEISQQIALAKGFFENNNPDNRIDGAQATARQQALGWVLSRIEQEKTNEQPRS